MAVVVKQALESQHFTMVESLRKRFQDCLDRDDSNIRPGAVGDHVVAIQKALIRIEGDKISKKDREALDKEMNLKKFGDKTREIVFKYKGDRRIQRQGQPLDPIVGRMTIDSLDTAMKRIEGDDSIVKTVFQDVLIRILGQAPDADVAGQPTTEGQAFLNVPPTAEVKKLVNTEEYLKTHLQLQVLDFNGGHENFKGRNTDPNPGILAAAGLIRDSLPVAAKAQGKGDQVAVIGKVIVIGWSSGGRRAAALVPGLVAARMPVSYLGLIDAAFDNASDPVQTTRVSVGDGDSIYEDTTNVLTKEGFEFHGPVPGTQDGRLDGKDDFYLLRKVEFERNLIKTDRDKVKFFNACHDKAVRDGLAVVQPKVLGMLGVRRP